MIRDMNLWSIKWILVSLSGIPGPIDETKRIAFIIHVPSSTWSYVWSEYSPLGAIS